MGAGCEGGKRQQQRLKVGTVYNGAFGGDLREGDGMIRYPDGTSFTGIFKKDVPYAGRLRRKTAALTRCRRGVTSLCCTTAPRPTRERKGRSRTRKSACATTTGQGGCGKGDKCKFLDPSQKAVKQNNDDYIEE